MIRLSVCECETHEKESVCPLCMSRISSNDIQAMLYNLMIYTTLSNIANPLSLIVFSMEQQCNI